jgi:hypothetical protein
MSYERRTCKDWMGKLGTEVARSIQKASELKLRKP